MHLLTKKFSNAERSADFVSSAPVHGTLFQVSGFKCSVNTRIRKATQSANGLGSPSNLVWQLVKILARAAPLQRLGRNFTEIDY